MAQKKAMGKLESKKIELSVSKQKRKDIALEGYEDLVFNVEDVRNDKQLQGTLRKALKNGAKVYLYGGLSAPEYADLLGLDKMTAKQKDLQGKEIEFRFDLDEKESAAIKGTSLKQKLDGEVNPDDLLYDLVGYTLNDSEHNKLVITNITSFDEEGNLVNTPQEQIIQEVIESTSETVDVEEAEYVATKAPNSNVFGFSKQLASADSTSVTSSSYRVYSSAYYGSTKVGSTGTDWILYQASSDADAYYDYFSVKDTTYIDASTGWMAKKLWVNHDIPYDRDWIDDWGPGDDGDGNYSFSFEWPWSIGVTYDMSTNPSINEMGSGHYDYGRWEVTDYNMDGDNFKPATSWRSDQSAGYARLDITEKATFTNSRGISATSSIYIAVSWLY